MSDILTRNGFLSLLEKIERWGSTETSHRTLTAHDAALRAERDAALARAEGAEEMLRRVRHESGIEFADPRVRYVAVQIDADLWDEMAALAAGVRRTPPCLCPWPEQDPAPRHKPGCALAQAGEKGAERG